MGATVPNRNSGKAVHAFFRRRLAGLAGQHLAVLLLVGLLSACATAPPESTEVANAFVMIPIGQTNIRDARPEFRDVFCAVLDARTAGHAQGQGCDELLVRLSDEGPQPRVPVALGKLPEAITVVFIAGLGSDCFDQAVLAKAEFGEYFARLGYDFKTIGVSGTSSSTNNARQIRDALAGMPALSETRKAFIVAHSKGIVDTLEALTLYPEVRQRVNGVVSLAGAVGGSPLADLAPDSALAIAESLPGSKCRGGDGGALESLRPRVRHGWLARNLLPAGLRFYSVVTLPTPQRISAGLKPSYELLSTLDSRNDGNLLHYDQIMPGGTLLGYVNADHWAIATDLGNSPSAGVRSLADRNDFPREVLLEAVLRFFEIDRANTKQHRLSPAR